MHGFALLLCFSALASAASATWTVGNAAQLSVDSDGTYSISVLGSPWLESAPDTPLFCLGKWHSVRDGTLKLLGMSKEWKGSEPGLGIFTACNYTWQTQGGAQSAVRMVQVFKYFVESDAFVFETVFPDGASGTAFSSPEHPNSHLHSVGEREFNSSTAPFHSFPSFAYSSCGQRSSALPSLGYMEWHGRFASDSTSVGTGLSKFQGGLEGGPLLLFDVRGVSQPKYHNAMVLSSFRHFKLTMASLLNDTATYCQTLSYGTSGYVTEVPVGFTSRVGLVPSTKGANAAMAHWGSVLRAAYNTTRVKSFVNTHLGYWTDNGAFYYGGYWQQHPKAVAADVLVQVMDGLRKQHVPVRYMQLDPWWYQESVGGCSNWSASPRLFPNGLHDFRQKLGVPLLLYSNFFAPNNTYDGNGSSPTGFHFMTSRHYNNGWAKGIIGNVYPNESLAFYNHILSRYSHEVMVGFEVDFLDFSFLLFDKFQQEVGASRQWLGGMAEAVGQHGCDVQYCMELASDLLQSVEFNAVTNARASEDDFPQNPNRWKIASTSLLIAALDLAPFFDDFWTTENQTGNPYHVPEPNIELRTIVSTLSAGPVGISDGFGFTNASRTMSVCREDGVLLQPSRAAVPLDAMLVPRTQAGGVPAGELWNSYSIIGEDPSPSAVYYQLLAVDVTTPVKLTPSTVFPAGSGSYVLRPHQSWQGCESGAAAKECVQLWDAQHVWDAHTAAAQGRVHSVVLSSASPVLPSGWALLGEVGKVVAVAPARFAAVRVKSASELEVELMGQPDEVVALCAVCQLQAGSVDSGRVARGTAKIGAQGTATVTLKAPPLLS